jgi:hypothetical protein
MSCVEARSWLYAAAAEDQLPDPVREHLRGCPTCQQRWRQLVGIDAVLRSLPGPPAPQAACTRFLTGPFARQPARPRPRLRWRGWGAVAALLLLALGIGMLAGWRAPKRVDAPRIASSYPDEPTLERFLGRHLRLAVSDRVERVRLMAATADDLASAALEAAEQDRPEALPLLADLYGVAVEGLAAAGPLVPAEQRQTVRDVVAELSRQADTLDAASSDRLPVVAQRLAAIARSARSAGEALTAGKPLGRHEVKLAGSPDGARERLAVLVGLAARLAASDDPVQRAEICAESAHHWSEAVLFAAARGEPERAERLGRQLGALLERAEEVNAALPPADGDRMAQRTAQARQQIEDNMKEAPPAARAGLQRAWKASGGGALPPAWRDRPGKELPPGLKDRADRGKGPGKGKGKAKGKSDDKP